MFLRNIRLLSPDIQRWHRENITALGKVLAKQGIEASDVCSMTSKMVVPLLGFDGTRISKRFVQELIQNYGETAHIRDVRVSPHSFRHSMAKYYISAGDYIFYLKKILGQSTLDVVRRYVELNSCSSPPPAIR